MEITENTKNSSLTEQSHCQQNKSNINNCDIKMVADDNPHQDVNVKIVKNRDEEKIKNLKETIPDINNIFKIHRRIGSGTFSTVFLASLRKKYNDEIEDKDELSDNKKRKYYAIKHIVPTSSPQRIIKELKCLIDIGGVDNVIGVSLCLRRNENVAFVMPYIEHTNFQSYYKKMCVSEVQLYMKNLLIALKRVHKFNIIHRDVKPYNFLYNRKKKEFLLIDFGLAQNVISRADREASLLKRKITDDGNLINGTLNNNVDNSNCNNNKKICLDNQQKSPEKMPLKQLNGLTTLTSTNVINQIGNAGSLLTSSEQTNKNIKTNESSNKSNIQFDRSPTGTLQYPNKKDNLYLKSTTINDHKQQQVSSPSSSNNQQSQKSCHCFGKPQVCKVCLLRKEIPASRAGTPGYRPPEVLLKYTEQTTAVDIWAVGVIFISILSGVYPFFKAPDDFVALAEVVMLFGDEAIRKTAFTLGRQITMSRKCKPLNLRRLCVRLRNRNKIDHNLIQEKYKKLGKTYEECSNCQQISYDCLCEKTKYKLEDIGEDIFPDSAYDFLSKLLEINPHKRITAAKALNHPFLREKFD
ncbi:cell division cycle 7-related protein kinase-like [Condylostylus longicornis]|uniref:cell division cycle 7-related protein kinase-like n=1 Tax=Condylostylus longicornis TaxID=2530218 RepID=UPI00244E08FF|nr:cell division cycle 7-related protein kinase-like [Condylostylus longicornis]